MLLERTLQRNPQLIEAAIQLHQERILPAATYVIDLDAVAENVRAMAAAARERDLRVYLMTKQNGRNPFLARVGLAQLRPEDKIVAVETIEAHVLERWQLALGHVGHLSNVPEHQAEAVVAMEPDAITVYNVEAARRVSAAASRLGREQALYVRVNRVGDEIFRGMVGGWDIDSCVEEIAPILDLPNVRLAGLTMHPVISYRNRDAYSAEPNDAFFTMIEAKEKLEAGLGLERLRVNCAANSNTVTFGTLARHGATDVEPGMAITGSSLFHALQDLPEKPAQCYISEVMHHWQGEVYTLGGGMTYVETFGDVFDEPPTCLAGRTLEQARETRLQMRFKGVIDYHIACEPEGRRPEIGEAAVYVLHPQYFVNRCYVAAVSGISRGEPRLEGLFDSATNALDPRTLETLPPEAVLPELDRVATAYAPAAEVAQE